MRIFAAIFALSLLLSACTAVNNVQLNTMTTEERSVSGISSVNLAAIGHLIIKVGNTESLRIEAEKILIGRLVTEVINGELMIRTQNNVSLNATRPVNYYLTVKKLEAVTVSSGGNIEAPDLEAERFSVTIAGTGSLVMGNLTAGMLNVNISSSGNVRMGLLSASSLEIDLDSTGNLDISGGEVRTQKITIGSSGSYTAKDLTSDEAEILINSTGSATVWVRNLLNARLNSSGDLRYIGNPIVNAATNSSGGVIRISK